MTSCTGTAEYCGIASSPGYVDRWGQRQEAHSTVSNTEQRSLQLGAQQQPFAYLPPWSRHGACQSNLQCRDSPKGRPAIAAGDSGGLWVAHLGKLQ